MPCNILWDSIRDSSSDLEDIILVPERTVPSRIWPLRPSRSSTAKSPTIDSLPEIVSDLFSNTGPFISDPYASHIQEKHPDPLSIGELSWYFSSEKQINQNVVSKDILLSPSSKSTPRHSVTSYKGWNENSVVDVTDYLQNQETLSQSINSKLIGSVRYDLIFGVDITNNPPPFPKKNVKTGLKNYLKFLEKDKINNININHNNKKTHSKNSSRNSNHYNYGHGGHKKKGSTNSNFNKPSITIDTESINNGMGNLNIQNKSTTTSPIPSSSPLSSTINQTLQIRTSNLSINSDVKSTESDMVTAIAGSSISSKNEFYYPKKKSYLVITCLHFKKNIKDSIDTNSETPHNDVDDNKSIKNSLEKFSTFHRHKTPNLRQIVFSFDDYEDIISIPGIKDNNGILGPRLKVKLIDQLYIHLKDSCIPFDTIGTSNIDEIIKRHINVPHSTTLSEKEIEDYKNNVLLSIPNDIKNNITHIRERNKIFYILINPFGGTGKASLIFKEIVEPMLKVIGIPYKMEHTEYRDHAKELVQNLNSDLIRSIFTVSGDGLFHEVINGILSRPDWEKASKYLPIGTIGAGTSNAMSKNLDALTQVESTFGIIKGKTTLMDVFSIVQNGQVTYSHLSVTWTLIADLDLDSETYRWMGSFRVVFGALIRLMNMRSYSGRVYMLPIDYDDSKLLQDTNDDDNSNNEEKEEENKDKRMFGTNQELNGELKYIGPKLKYTQDSKSYKKWPIKIEDDFSLFIATNLPFISSEFFTSPYIQFSDGKMDIIYTNHINRLDMINSLSDQESGKFVYAPGIKLEQVKAFVLEPGPRTNNPKTKPEEIINEYNISISGERYCYDTVRVEVHPRILNLLCPFWLKENEWLDQFEKSCSNSINLDVHNIIKSTLNDYHNHLNNTLGSII